MKEQLLYEMHDPAAYLTPDVVADISEAEVEQVGPDRVAVRGVRGRPRPDTLKVIVFFAGGWLGEGEISYAGPNAEARARLAADVIRRRLGDGLEHALRPDRGAERVRRRRRPRSRPAPPGDARDVRLRVAASHPDRARVEAAAARGDGPLYLRPGRRRGRADRDHARGSTPPRASCPATSCRPRSPSWRSDGERSHPRPAAPPRPRPRRGQGRPLNISVIAYRPEVFPLLVEQVTEARVADAVPRPPAGRRPAVRAAPDCTR